MGSSLAFGPVFIVAEERPGAATPHLLQAQKQAPKSSWSPIPGPPFCTISCKQRRSSGPTPREKREKIVRTFLKQKCYQRKEFTSASGTIFLKEGISHA